MTAIAIHAATFFLLWLFVGAGVHKVQLANLTYYTGVFTSYGMPTKWVKSHIVRLVGLLEITTGILVVLPATQWIGAMLAVLVLLAYLLVMARQLILGRTEMDCGCGGPSGVGTSISPLLLVRNAVLVAMALLCVVPLSKVGLYQTLPLPALLLIVGLAVLMILLYLSAEQLISSGQKLERLKRR